MFLSSAFAEAPRPPREGTWEMRGTLSYFDTTANFTNAGSESLPNGLGYTNLLGDFRFTYDHQADWRFYSGMTFAKAESSTNSNMGVNEIYAGAQNWYDVGKFEVAPEAEFTYPLWNVDETSDSPLLGEGAMKLRAGSWAFLPLNKFKPFAYVGYEYRNEGRAHVIPYAFGAKARVDRIWFQGEVRGFERIMDDSESNALGRLNRSIYQFRANSGSMRYYSINPSYSELAAEAGTRFGDWGVFGGFAYAVNGQNTADGWTAYGGLSFSPKALHKPNEKRDETFDPRGEKYDESVFRESAPSRPSAPEPSEEQGIGETPPSEPVDTPRSAAPPEDDMTTSPPPPPADSAAPPKVDMQLELRRVVKKKKVAKPPAIRSKKADKQLDKMMDDAENFLEKKK